MKLTADARQYFRVGVMPGAQAGPKFSPSGALQFLRDDPAFRVYEYPVALAVLA